MDACASAIFLFSTENSLFGQIWSKKNIEIVSLSWNLVPWVIEYTEFNGDVDFFCFRPETSFLGKFGPKNQNGQF